jgi:hypothetical protein
MATELQVFLLDARSVASGGQGVIMRLVACDKESIMGCNKDILPVRKAKPGEFRCKDCGVVSKKKKQLCNPKKVKE